LRHILALGNRRVLQQFACSNVLVAFDYDGTVAPIVSDPERAHMRARTRGLLEQLARLYPCIVISGRAQEDALRLLSGVAFLGVIGNHGVEPWAATDQMLNEVRLWLPTLEKRFAPFAGVRIEDKGFSVAVHYRQSREKKKARAAILKVVRSLGDVRVVGGKQVVNVLPAGAPHKGMALERERARLQCDTAIYVGDDETDEDVFMLNQPGQLLTIRVGPKQASLAEYCIRNQGEIDRLIRALLDFRRTSRKQERA
jgi:trehalose 6-phosphate phosphatase